MRCNKKTGVILEEEKKRKKNYPFIAFSHWSPKKKLYHWREETIFVGPIFFFYSLLHLLCSNNERVIPQWITYVVKCMDDTCKGGGSISTPNPPTKWPKKNDEKVIGLCVFLSPFKLSSPITIKLGRLPCCYLAHRAKLHKMDWVRPSYIFFESRIFWLNLV